MATMKKATFDALMESMQQALEHAQGKRELRTTVLPDPPAPMTAKKVKALRAELNASQSVFALYLNVSTKLVQAWEAGRRAPEGAALRLLKIARTHPKIVFPGPTSPVSASARDIRRSRRSRASGSRDA